MFGPPKDEEDKCNACMYLGDDHGDNHTTIKCSLPKGHEGPHKESFVRKAKPVEIIWHVDESYHCPKHGHVYPYRDKCPCIECYYELPDCLDCKGAGFEQIGDKYIDCKKCDGEGKILE